MAWVTWRQHRFALAGVAALLGALAVYLWITGLQLHHAYAAAAACHPASSLPAVTLVGTTFGTDWLPGEWLSRLAAGGARADRGVRRGAGAGPGAGDRHLPVRLDPGLRPVALDARQAGAARGRGGRRRRGVQRAVLLVLPAVRHRGNQALQTRLPRSLPACSTCAGSRSPPGRWPPSRSAPWPACSSAGSSPRSPPPWPPTPGSPSRRAVPAPALPDAAGHQQPQPAWFRVDHQPVGPRADGKPLSQSAVSQFLQGYHPAASRSDPTPAGTSTR
jgi:hypothetical protein